MRIQYLGGVRISRLITGLVIVGLTYILYRYLKHPSRGIVRFKDAPITHQMSHQEIDDHLHDLKDTRPEQCRVDYLAQLAENRPSVSILLDFHDAEFYNLKLTIESIMRHTRADLYHEIILLDDGSSQGSIRHHAASVLLEEKYSKVRAYRSEEHHGRGSTRLKASQVADGSILVFVSSDVVVNVGWLEPLLVAIEEDHRRVVVPHSDNFLSDHRFYQMDDRVISTFSWALSTVYMETAEENKFLRTPIMRGDVVAVSKDFLESIGNYDDTMPGGGGHDIELSLRAWLCGGEILTSMCSRIATHNALKPPGVSSHYNYRRIVELWLNDYKDIAYTQGEVKGDMDSEEKLDIEIRRSYINKQTTCRNMDWFLNNVAVNILAPPEDMVRYGKLKVMSSYCARVTKEMGSEVILVLCRPYMYDPSMIFTLDSSRRIRMGDMCMMATSAASRVMLAECQENNKLQGWEHLDTGLLVSEAFPDICLTHVSTQSESGSHMHHIQTYACMSGQELKQQWTFINY